MSNYSNEMRWIWKKFCNEKCIYSHHCHYLKMEREKEEVSSEDSMNCNIKMLVRYAMGTFFSLSSKVKLNYVHFNE